MVIDVNRCVACYNCFVACKDEFADHSWLPYSQAQPDEGPAWISVHEVERGRFPKVKVCYVPRPCMQCEKPLCLKVAVNGALFQREDGVVIIDPEKSKGHREIAKACPYGCILWNEALDIPQKCTFCAHLLDEGWKEPRCVEVCPTQALRFGEQAQFADVIPRAEQLHPEYRTNPAVFYLGLPRLFIAGSVYCDQTGECLPGAKVSLATESGGTVAGTETNNFGDFEFDGLEKGLTYLLRIEANGYEPINIKDLHVEKDLVLEDIYLQRR